MHIWKSSPTKGFNSVDLRNNKKDNRLPFWIQIRAHKKDLKRNEALWNDEFWYEILRSVKGWERHRKNKRQRHHDDAQPNIKLIKISIRERVLRKPSLIPLQLHSSWYHQN